MNFQQISLTLRNQKRLLLSKIQKKQHLITNIGILQTENFRYRVLLGLERAFNLQIKEVRGWFYFRKIFNLSFKVHKFFIYILNLLFNYFFTYYVFYMLGDFFFFFSKHPLSGFLKSRCSCISETYKSNSRSV